MPRLAIAIVLGLSLGAFAPAAAASGSELVPPRAVLSSDMPLGVLLEDPRARLVLQRLIPNFLGRDTAALARAMPLRQLQQFAPDMLNDDILATIDGALAELER